MSLFSCYVIQGNIKNIYMFYVALCEHKIAKSLHMKNGVFQF